MCLCTDDYCIESSNDVKSAFSILMHLAKEQKNEIKLNFKQTFF